MANYWYRTSIWGFFLVLLFERRKNDVDRSSKLLVMHHSKMHRKKGALNLKKCNTINSFIDVHNGTLHIYFLSAWRRQGY